MLRIEVTSTRPLQLFFVVTQTPNLSIIQWRRRKRTPEERMKGKTTSLKSAPKPQPATKAEINQAIEALTHEDTERIEQTALNRINRIGRAANRRSHKDLIQEAFIRILDGTRQWYKDRVSFTHVSLARYGASPASGRAIANATRNCRNMPRRNQI